MDFPTTPGVYPDLTYEQYNAIPAIRGSDLTPYLVSPRRAKWKKANPPTSDALRLGLAYHTAILEPHRFDQDVAVLGPCCSEVKSGKRKGMKCGNSGKYLIDGASYCGTHGSEDAADTQRTIISEHELNQIISAKTAIMQRTEIVTLLNEPHQNELTLVWEDKETGERCKARLDQKNADGTGMVGELKTTSAPMLSRFHLEKEVRKFGYHIKAAWQKAGCDALGIGTSHYLFVFVQTVQDCDVAGYWLHENSLQSGHKRANECLQKLINSRDTNHYPGIQPDGIGLIEVQEYYNIDEVILDDAGVVEVDNADPQVF